MICPFDGSFCARIPIAELVHLQLDRCNSVEIGCRILTRLFLTD